MVLNIESIQSYHLEKYPRYPSRSCFAAHDSIPNTPDVNTVTSVLIPKFASVVNAPSWTQTTNGEFLVKSATILSCMHDSSSLVNWGWL